MRGRKVKSRNCALASDLVRVLSAGLPLRGSRPDSSSGRGDARVEFLRLKCVSD